MHEFIFTLAALGCFLFYVYFSFCDGFKIGILPKLLWATVFLVNCFIVLKMKGKIDLALILPVPCIFALFLAWREMKKRK